MGSITDGHKPCNEEFFQRDAKELAIRLLGKYLYCQESGILVRIMHTEAYPDGMLQKCVTQLLTKSPNLQEFLQADDPPFPDKAGVVVRLGEALFRVNPRLETTGRGHYLYVTAGGEGEARGVVLIRSCVTHVPIYEGSKEEDLPAYLTTIMERFGIKRLRPERRSDLLLDPVAVAKALGHDWESNPNLFEEGGVQLLHEKLVARRVPEPESEPESEHKSELLWEAPWLPPVVHGPRIAPKASYVQHCLYGRDPDVAAQQLHEMLRFALETNWLYPYQDWDYLEPLIGLRRNC